MLQKRSMICCESTSLPVGPERVDSSDSPVHFMEPIVKFITLVTLGLSFVMQFHFAVILPPLQTNV